MVTSVACWLLKVLLGGVCMILGALLWQHMKRSANIPPGPLGWPYVGSVLSMGKHPGVFYATLSKKYGKVFSIYIGNKLNIIINDAKLAREAFLKHGDVFSGRTRSFIFDDLLPRLGLGHISHVPGLVFSEGRVWKEQRKFALTALREFGMGKVSLETKIKEEIARFLNEIKLKNGEPFNIRILMNNSVSNVISSIVLGVCYDYDNEEFLKLMRAICEDASNTLLMSVIDVFPWTRFLPGVRKSYLSFINNQKLVFDFIVKHIDNHIESFDSDNIRDFIDAYINHMKQEEKDGHADTTFNIDELSAVAADLFFAGTETTATTLRWAFLFMMKHPEVMKKVQKEIDDVVGRSRMPSCSDRSSMPYVEATLTEIQRIGNIVPIVAPHTNSEEAQLDGYTIPKLTPVTFNPTAVLMNPELFPEPEVFRPERHLNENGQFVKNEDFLPFSVGRRVCLGESLTKMELFLYFTSVLQHFDIQKEESDTELDVEPVVGFICSPSDYKMRVVLR